MKKKINKNAIIVVLLIMLSIGVITLYTTYAYENVNNIIIEESESNYNLLITLKNSTNKEITISPKEEKFLDINLKNPYTATIRYGMYYYMINPTTLPNNVTITLAEDSEDALENTIKPSEERNVSIKITNDSEYTINLIIGALIGFENGNIEDLITNNEILIK